MRCDQPLPVQRSISMQGKKHQVEPCMERDGMRGMIPRFTSDPPDSLPERSGKPVTKLWVALHKLLMEAEKPRAVLRLFRVCLHKCCIFCRSCLLKFLYQLLSLSLQL